MTYSAQAQLLSDRLGGIDVDLVKVDRGELPRESLEDRADDLAGAAPLRPEIEDRVLVLLYLCNSATDVTAVSRPSYFFNEE